MNFEEKGHDDQFMSNVTSYFSQGVISKVMTLVLKVRTSDEWCVFWVLSSTLGNNCATDGALGDCWC